MNPKACFFQTLIGLVCYSFGLRDRGYDMLNALGICYSSDQVRKHGSTWANRRRATDELDRRQFWRVSFDKTLTCCTQNIFVGRTRPLAFRLLALLKGEQRAL